MEAVNPLLLCDVIQSAVLCTRRTFQDVLAEFPFCGLQSRFTRCLRCPPESFPEHGAVDQPITAKIGNPAIISRIDQCRPCELNYNVLLTGFQKCLGNDSLFPILALHRQSGASNLND